MLEKSFTDVYTKFKLHYYKKIFSRFETREASLTAVETFCVEVIQALGLPTVNEFAQYVGISQPNATHKIQSLIKKGYVVKSRSPDDGREYTLSVTERFYMYYNIINNYTAQVVERMKARFTSEELSQFKRMLDIINHELMPEAGI